MKNKIIFIIIFLFFIQNVQALTLDSASAYPYKSYACQPITIFGNFSGGTPDSVYANIYIGQTIFEHNIFISQSHNVTMTNVGGGIWTAIWGDDSTIHWGQRDITYNAYTGAILEQFGATNVVFVMNSGCIGTGKTNYTQMSPPGLGNFSKLIWGSPSIDILQLGTYYWLASWGYMFYIIIMVTIFLSIIMKTQNVMSGVYALLLMLLFAAPLGIVPLEYRDIFGIILALCIGGIYVKFFMKG